MNDLFNEKKMFNDKITFSPLVYFSDFLDLKTPKAKLVRNANPIFSFNGTFSSIVSLDNKQQIIAKLKTSVRPTVQSLNNHFDSNLNDSKWTASYESL